MKALDMGRALEAFRNMRPVAAAYAPGSGEREAHVQFDIIPDGSGGAAVRVAGDADHPRLSRAERALVEGIRCSGRAGAFGFDTGWTAPGVLGEGASEAAAADIEPLGTLLPECTSVWRCDGAKRTRLLPGEGTARLLLDLRDEGSDVVPSLTAAGPEGEKTVDALLGEDLVLAGDTLLRVKPLGENAMHLPKLLAPVPAASLEQYLSVVLSYIDSLTPRYKGHEARFAKTADETVPTLVLEKVASDQALYLRLTQTPLSATDGSVEDIPLTRTVAVNPDGTMTVRGIAVQDLDTDMAFLMKLIEKSAPSRQAKKEIYREGEFFIIPAETASPFLCNCLPEVLGRFRLLGSEKLREYKITAAVPRLNVRLSSGIDYLEGDAEVELDGQALSLADLLRQFDKKRYVQLADGNRAIIDSRYITRLRRLFDLKDKKGKVRVSPFDLPEIDDLASGEVKGKGAERLRAMFAGFNGIAASKLPKLPVKASLRPYQEEGVKWIKYLHDNNVGGCLADDMGLGKTLQTIAMLSTLYPGSDTPSLVVMPRSLLFNWQNEIARFAPGIRTAAYYGPDRNLEEAVQADVVFTTYAVVRNDIERLREVKWHYAVLDESQHIKNAGTQAAQAVTMLDAEHRLALSGTPMENNLTEIYSLFRFLNPTMFGSADEFNAAYTFPVQKHGDKDALRALRRKIYPFLLRRLKREVLDELPDRIEQTLYVEMTPAQERLYNQRRLEFLAKIKEAIGREGVQKSQFMMFQALGELRRIASVPESLTDGTVASPKIEEMAEQLRSAVENGHKCVVFFNFIAGLELVADRLAQLGIGFEQMTGATTAAKRKAIVEDFQTNPATQVLLMTLKVGGVGLNLTAADTVFIFEPWWNKAAEDQAIDRLHRIGQKNTVNAYSVITVGTIEEKILQLQAMKKELFDGLVGSDGASAKSLSEEDINFILS